MTITTKTIAAAGIAALLLTACGGGGGGGGGNPAAPTLAVSTAIKTLVFDWAEVADATHYRLFEQLQGTAEAQLGGDIPAGTTQYQHTVPLWTRRDAQYRLQACNSAGCTDSATQTWTTALRNAAIGYVKASNTGAGDRFGDGVALSADGRTLAVGAGLEASNAVGVNGAADDNSAAQSGAVYVYTRSGSQWVFQAYLKASNTNADDRFGTALSLSADGNTLVVGAPFEDSDAIGIGGNQLSNAFSESGAVYVFERNGDTWSQTQYVKAINTRAEARFGASVAVSGDGGWFVVGAPGESGNATGVNPPMVAYNTPGSGAAYVFQRTNAGWVPRAYLKGFQSEIDDRLGAVVAISHDGDRVALGVPQEDGSATGLADTFDNLTPSSGAAILYERNGDAWSLEAYVKASNTGANDQFGSSVSLAGDGATLAIGARLEASQASGIGGDQADNSSQASGAVYVFDLQGGVWAQRAYVKATNNRASSRFGLALGLSHDGRVLAIGASNESNVGLGLGGDGLLDDGSASSTGAVYLLDRLGNSWAFRHYLKAPNPNAFDSFGYSLALSSDGGTLAVGAYGEDSNATGIGNGDPNDASATNAGAAYLY